MKLFIATSIALAASLAYANPKTKPRVNTAAAQNVNWEDPNLKDTQEEYVADEFARNFSNASKQPLAIPVAVTERDSRFHGDLPLQRAAITPNGPARSPATRGGGVGRNNR